MHDRLNMLKEITELMLLAENLLVIGEMPEVNDERAMFVSYGPKDHMLLLRAVDLLNATVAKLRAEGEELPYITEVPDSLVKLDDDLVPPMDAHEILAELFPEKGESDGAPEA